MLIFSLSNNYVVRMTSLVPHNAHFNSTVVIFCSWGILKHAKNPPFTFGSSTQIWSLFFCSCLQPSSPKILKVFNELKICIYCFKLTWFRPKISSFVHKWNHWIKAQTSKPWFKIHKYQSHPNIFHLKAFRYMKVR